MTEEHIADGIHLKREATIDQLREHFARDDLEIEAFERRVDEALRAPSGSDLDKLVSDLPSLTPQQTLPQVALQPQSIAIVPQSPEIVPADRVKKIGFAMAVLGGNGRRGRWIPPRRLFSLFYLGGGELDFRDVLFVHPVTDVYIGAFLGGVRIIVPPGYAVEINGIPFLGGFRCADDVGIGAGPASPLLRVRGIFFLGGASVEMRYPGESKADAKDRRQAEKRSRHKLLEG